MTTGSRDAWRRGSCRRRVSSQPAQISLMHDGDRGTEKSARSHDTAVETRPADPTASAFDGGLRFYKKRSWGDRVVLEMGRNPNQTSTNRTRTRVLPTTEPNPNREVKKTRKNRILPEPYVYTTRTEHEPTILCSFSSLGYIVAKRQMACLSSEIVQ